MTMENKPKRLFIGIPCYDSAPADTLLDFMSFTYYLGSNYPDWEVYLNIIDKSEQFRARNKLVEGAIGIGAQYMLMLDDDMIIDTENNVRPTKRYGFVMDFIEAMEEDPEIGIMGALYFQRGGSYHPVAMNRAKDSTYYWLTGEDLSPGRREVGVVGGGCIVINMKVFDRIPSPWFEPEMQVEGPSRGTDVQICEKIREAGWKVIWDTSVELGHVSQKRVVITAANRLEHAISANRYVDKVQESWDDAGMMTIYRMDVEEYMGKKPGEILKMAEGYEESANLFCQYKDPKDYYRSLGEVQLARQYYFHSRPGYGPTVFLQPMKDMIGMEKLYGLDFGCGSAPLGFELAMKGQKMDLVDVDGAGAFEFVKWRAKRRDMKIGFELGEDYDFIMLMDVIEHIQDWEDVLGDLIRRLRHGGILVTNYFENCDDTNPEHISMDKKAVKRFLVDHDMMPGNQNFWRKGMIEMGALNEKIAS